MITGIMLLLFVGLIVLGPKKNNIDFTRILLLET